MRKGIAKPKGLGGYERKDKLTIGVVGTHRGTGTTHTSVMISAFAGIILGEKTGCLEINHSGDFGQMERKLLGECSEDKSFTYQKIKFYKDVKDTEIPIVLNQGDSCFVFDFGSTLKDNWHEFVRCDKKIVVCSAAAWKSLELAHFLQRNDYLYGIRSWYFVIPFGNEQQKKMIKKEWDIDTIIIPYESNPFMPSDNSILLFCRTLV